jgi:hypothetical protein
MLVFLLVSIHRVREEDRWIRNYVAGGAASTSIPVPYFGVDGGRFRLENGGIRNDSMLSILDTLAGINQDRIERGEPTVSLDSYLAFQRVLSDRSIWVGLAERYQVQRVRRPVLSQDQLQTLCPAWTMTGSTTTHNDDNDNPGIKQHDECSICLSCFEINDTLRTLPCHHSYHKDCIDQWIQQSLLCPMCKRLLLVLEDSEMIPSG